MNQTRLVRPGVSKNRVIAALAAFAISGLAFAALFKNPQWDYLLTVHYFDAQLNAFPLRSATFYEFWMHSVLRKVLWLSPLLVLTLLSRSWYRTGWSYATKCWLWLLLAQLAAALSVSILKAHTTPVCPWDFTQFGGLLSEPAFAFVNKASSGNCFPAGHPSGGWALLAWAYFLRESKPDWSRVAFWSALLLGALMAWVQIARGAHLLSHVLWSLWVCWLVVWLAYVLAWPEAKAANASDSP